MNAKRTREIINKVPWRKVLNVGLSLAAIVYSGWLIWSYYLAYDGYMHHSHYAIGRVVGLAEGKYGARLVLVEFLPKTERTPVRLRARSDDAQIGELYWVIYPGSISGIGYVLFERPADSLVPQGVLDTMVVSQADKDLIPWTLSDG